MKRSYRSPVILVIIIITGLVIGGVIGQILGHYAPILNQEKASACQQLIWI